jgi:hypothetical protein
MSVEELMEWMDTLRPSAYSDGHKTAWLNDLEAIVWTQVFLQPAGLWQPHGLSTDGQQRLLLPVSWRRVYTAYLEAMIDFANGEYTQYENAMTLYNDYMCQLGAWYADTFAPADQPARWVRLGVADQAGLQQKNGQLIGSLPPGAGALALEWRVGQAPDAEGTITLAGAGGQTLWQREVTAGEQGVFRSLGLVLPEREAEPVRGIYTGDELTAGQMEFWALVQPVNEKRGYR